MALKKSKLTKSGVLAEYHKIKSVYDTRGNWDLINGGNIRCYIESYLNSETRKTKDPIEIIEIEISKDTQINITFNDTAENVIKQLLYKLVKQSDFFKDAEDC